MAVSDAAIQKRLEKLRKNKDTWLKEMEDAEQRIQQLRRQTYD